MRRRAINGVMVPETQKSIHPYECLLDSKEAATASPCRPGCVTGAHLLLMLCVISRSSNRSFENKSADDIIALKTISCASGTWNTRADSLVPLARMEHGTTFGMHFSNLNPITKLNVELSK